MADTTTISDLTEKQTLVDTDKILVEDANGVVQALLGSAITDKINGALANYQNIASFYTSGFRGIYKISIPFTATNTTSQGQIIISGRTGNSWIINFYNITSSELEHTIKVFQLKGDYYDSMLNSIVKFDYDTENNKINIYLKHDNYNSRMTFIVNGGYRLGDNYENVQIQALTDITEYTNANYSKTIEKIATESDLKKTYNTTEFQISSDMNTNEFKNYILSHIAEWNNGDMIIITNTNQNRVVNLRLDKQTNQYFNILVTNYYMNRPCYMRYIGSSWIYNEL